MSVWNIYIMAFIEAELRKIPPRGPDGPHKGNDSVKKCVVELAAAASL